MFFTTSSYGVPMKPECLSEQLLFNTVRLEANNGSCGTGFYFNFTVGNDVCPTIITYKHVVNNNPDEEMTFFVHLDDGSHGTSESFRVTYAAKWVFHPTHDLCFCFAAPVFRAVKQVTGKDVFYIANDMSIMATPEKLRDLRAVESITMVGYPTGIPLTTFLYSGTAIQLHIQHMTSIPQALALLTLPVFPAHPVRRSISLTRVPIRIDMEA